MAERICQRPGCGRSIRSNKRSDARWCGRSCESKAARAARKLARLAQDSPDVAELLRTTERGGSESLADLYERSAGSGRHADLPGDVDAAELDADDDHADDADTRRFLGQPDASRRRTLWAYWSAYGKRHGVQPAEQAAERAERSRASQESNIERLENAPGQVEQRHVPASRGVVGRAGMESRKLNAHYRRASEMPPPDMQGPVYQPRMEPPQVIGRGDRGSRSYSWQMDDGFRF